jgi:flavin-dependent dehydrogenase
MGVNFERDEYIPFEGIRYIDGDVVAEGRFSCEPGWGIRRTTLTRRMYERAQQLGASLRYGVKAEAWHVGADQQVVVDTVQGSLTSQLLVGADGLHSKVRRQAKLEGPRRGLMRYGVRRHFEVEPWSSFVEVYWADGIEAYVTPVAAQEVGVALLWSGERTDFETLLERFPPLKKRLSVASHTSPTRGAGPFRQSVRRRYRGPVALVGDAAGYLDALTGEGLSLAFVSASALIENIKDERGLRDYEKNYRKLSRNYYWMTTLLLRLAQNPHLRTRVIKSLAQDPRLFDSFLSISTSEKSLVTEGFRNLMRLLASLTVGHRCRHRPGTGAKRPSGAVPVPKSPR